MGVSEREGVVWVKRERCIVDGLWKGGGKGAAYVEWGLSKVYLSTYLRCLVAFVREISRERYVVWSTRIGGHAIGWTVLMAYRMSAKCAWRTDLVCYLARG